MCFYLIRPIQITSVIANRIFGPNKKKNYCPRTKTFFEPNTEKRKNTSCESSKCGFPPQISQVVSAAFQH